MSFKENTTIDSDKIDTAVPCEGNNCNFWGKRSSQNLCSQCFKEKVSLRVDSDSNKSALKDIPNSSVNLEDRAPEKESTESKDIISSSAEVAKSKPIVKPKLQKDTRRCFQCSKFIGFRGIKCKCGFVFCGSHRIPEEHTCSFDFEEAARAKFNKTKTEAAIADALDERL